MASPQLRKLLGSFVFFGILEAVIFSYTVLIYLMIHYFVIPNVKIERKLDLVFDPSCYLKETMPPPVCTFPTVNFSLSEQSTSLLAFGQPYTTLLKVILPDSPHNERAGMGIFFLELLNTEDRVVINAQKPFTMAYYSPLTRLMKTMLWAPIHLLWNSGEEQTIFIEILSDLINSVENSVVKGRLVMASNNHHWLAVELLIYAKLSMFQSLLYYHTWFCGFTFVATAMTLFNGTLFILCLLRYFMPPENVRHHHSKHSGFENEEILPIVEVNNAEDEAYREPYRNGTSSDAENMEVTHINTATAPEKSGVRAEIHQPIESLPKSSKTNDPEERLSSTVNAE